MTSPWTADRLDRLKAAWINGDSASKIAKSLGGGITRSAVCGKVHRLGLSETRQEPASPNRGAAQPRKTRPTPPRRSPPVPAGPIAVARPVVTALVTSSERRDVVRLGQSCAWPMGDPGTSSFRFCAADVVPGRQYCGDHCRKAGISAEPKPMLVMGRVARPYRFGHADR